MFYFFSFDKDLEDLADIQVPVELLQLDELSPNQDTCSLLDWISQKDRQCSLRQMADQCLQAVTQLDEQALSDLREESDRILQLVENDQNKKIKKIECRLHELDKMLSVCKKLLNDQELLTAAFVSHQQSAHSLQDPSIFPDLCDSHTTQLQLMFNNYLHMTAIAKKFNAAKMELVHNLHTRLRVIVTCETELSDIRWKIFVYGENLKKLKRNLEVLEQVNAAPDVYNAAIREINRRQHFSTRFRRWSTALAEFGQRLYQQECERRESFRQVLDGHFLKAIFTGLDDELPKFAVTKPPEFDLHLPNVPTDDSVDLVHFPKVSCPLCTDDEPNTSQEIDDKKADLCSQSVLMNSNQASDMKVASDSGTVAETAIATKIEKSAMDLDVQSGACGVPKATEKSVEKKTEDLNLIEKSVVENKTDCDMEQRLRKEYESKMADMQAEMNAKLEQEKARIHEEFMASATSPAITFATKLNQSQSTIIKSGAESDSGEPPMNANGTVGSATATTGSTTGRKCNAKMKTKKAQQLIETLKQANRDKQLLIDQLSAKQQVTSNVLAKIKRTLASVESHGTTSSSSLDPWMLCKTVCQEIAAFGELDQIWFICLSGVVS